MNAAVVAFGNLLLAAYALDTGVSVVEEVFRSLAGSELLVGVRNAVAGFALMLGVFCLPILWLTPRLPIGVFGLLCVSLLWFSAGAFPVLFAFDSISEAGPTLAAIQLAIAGVAFGLVRRHNGGEGWFLRAEMLRGPAFSLKRSALISLASVLLGVPIVVAYLGAGITTYVEAATSEFVSFERGGIFLSDRVYERGDREVRLVGMMHVGEGGAYADLVKSFAEDETIVLQEGITDDLELLAGNASYEPAAEFLGLEQQGSFEVYLEDDAGDLPSWPVLRHADLDTSDFDPETVEWLNSFVALWSAEDSASFVEALSNLSPDEERAVDVFQRDILDKRNEHLLSELDLAIEEYARVVVPWGALHLPYIEGAILERGFDERARTKRRLVSWMTVLSALF